MMKAYYSLLLIVVNFITPAYAQFTNETFCSLPGYERPLRQTHIVIDGAMIEHEEGGPVDANKPWRKRVMSLLNVEDATILRRIAPRERIYISVAQADGSGLRNLFTGCTPLYSVEEQKALAGQESALSTFFGKGWQDTLEKQSDQFRRKLTLAMVDGAKQDNKHNKNSDKIAFIDSGLGQSLARGYNASLEYGLPRLIILTDLSRYGFAEGGEDVQAARRLARMQTVTWGADFGRAEIHLLGASNAEKSRDKEYLKALFLGAKGELLTITSLSGSIKEENAPQKVEIYRGTVAFPDGEFPLMLRLSLDVNQRAVNAWIEVQSDQIRFLPFDGGMACTSSEECTFLATGVFAQIWTDAPAGEPEFENWMPFVGFRNMKLTMTADRISGLITDSSGYIANMEEGLALKLVKVPNGIF